MSDAVWPSSAHVELVTFAASPHIPHALSAPLLERGVPKDMLERYQAASELTVVEMPDGQQFVCFGRVGYFGRVALNPHTGEVVELLDSRRDGSEWLVLPISSSLEQFSASVGVVLKRYPFDSPQKKEESDATFLERWEVELDRAVADLKTALCAIDPAVMDDPNGFWMTFLDDVQAGDFSTAGEV